jgi:hypothetical protein
MESSSLHRFISQLVPLHQDEVRAQRGRGAAGRARARARCFAAHNGFVPLISMRLVTAVDICRRHKPP